MSVARIHFYDVEEAVPDKGWVHYTSRVPGWEGVECRVCDVVREVGDCSAATVGFISPPCHPDMRVAEEAVRVSLAAPTFLDRIMTRSPFRDHEEWRRTGKKAYRANREERRRKFEAGSLVIVTPNDPKP